LADLPTLRAS
jgi:hypothetical protein